MASHTSYPVPSGFLKRFLMSALPPWIGYLSHELSNFLEEAEVQPENYSTLMLGLR